MKRKLLFICLVFFLCCEREVNHAGIDNKEVRIHKLLIKDYKALESNNDLQFQEKISKREFIHLFFEGIQESFLFLKNIKEEGVAYQYHTLLKKTLSLQNKRLLKHSLKEFKALNDKLTINHYNTFDGYTLFKFFSGRWFGLWNSHIVQHQWLLPWKLKPFSYHTSNYSISSFQTAWTGDGFGWNYQVYKDNLAYIIGYVCHFNNEGEITMKRPHVGFPQSNNTIIWLTKDHIYIESVCESQEFSINPKHYVISGLNFNKNKTHFNVVNTFQEVYFSSFIFGAEALEESHQ